MNANTQAAIRKAALKLLNKTELPITDLSTLSPVDWLQSQFYIPERIGQTPPAIQLAPYQQAVLDEAYRTDDKGNFIYSVIVWSDIKKSAKSSIAAAVALHRASTLPYSSIKVVANDLKQADSRVAFYARRAIELNEGLGKRVKIRPSGYAIRFTDMHSQIEAIPVDPKGEAGGNDDLIIFSELWAANQTAAMRMWSEMTLSPTKFGHSQRWVETYAGFTGESPLLEQLYETGVKQGKQLNLTENFLKAHPPANAENGDQKIDLSDLEVYANGSLLCLWNTHPRLPWQTPEYYIAEATVLLPSEFQRMHRNQWVSSQQSFVPIEWVRACEVEVLPPLDRYREVVIGIDAAVSDDCFAIVAVSRKDDKIIVRYARKWTPPQGGKLLFSNHDNPADTDYPEGEIRRLADEFNCIAFVYDAYQLESFCANLRAEGIGLFKSFSQGAPRLSADKALYDMIRERRLIYSNEPDLVEHIGNANSTADDRETLRIVKRAQSLKIDLAVALSMACASAFEYLPG